MNNFFYGVCVAVLFFAFGFERGVSYGTEAVLNHLRQQQTANPAEQEK